MADLTKRHRERIVWDDVIPGLAVRTRPSGHRSWVFVYRLKGAGRAAPPRRITLGACEKLSVRDARAEAKKLNGQVAQGRDPGADRDEQRAKLAAERTVNELLDAFLTDRRAKKKAATVDEYQRFIDRDVRGVLGRKKLGRVARADVSALHRAMADRPYQANRVLTVLAAAFAFGITEGLHIGTNPAAGIEPFKETPRERSLSDAEFARLGEALRRAETVGLPVAEKLKTRARGMSRKRRAALTGRKRGPSKLKGAEPALHAANPDAVAALRFLLLTGWREQEALTLEWAAVDFQRGFVTLADSKTGRAVRYLGAPALELLEERPRRGRYVFPSPLNRKDRPERPLVEIRRTWEAVREAAELPDLRLHDLRHAFGSASAGDLGLSLYVTGALLGHVRAETTTKYAHLAADPLKRAADAVAGRVAALINEPQPDTNVLPFAKRS